MAAPPRTAPPTVPPQPQPQVTSEPPPQEKGERYETEVTPINHKLNINPKPDVGENEEVLDPEIKIPQDEDFIEPPSLGDVVDPTKNTHKFLPKQGEVEKLVKQISHKVLRDTKLPGSLKDLKAAYLNSPHFRYIYLYLLQNKAPLNKGDAKRLENNARNYMVSDDLLFKIVE